jgi:hypothetical protein
MLFISLLLALILVLQTPAAKVQPMSPLTTGLAHAIKKQEPDWQYTPGVCTCPELVPHQVSHDVGVWDRIVNGKRQDILMDVYVVPSPSEATEWMGKFSRHEFGISCQMEKFEVGEEGYLLTCPKTHYYHIHYRKGRAIVEVSSDLKADTERFARYASELLPDP